MRFLLIISLKGEHKTKCSQKRMKIQVLYEKQEVAPLAGPVWPQDNKQTAVISSAKIHNYIQSQSIWERQC